MKTISKIELTEAMKEHLKTGSGHFSKFQKCLKIISSKAIISKEGESFKVEITLEIAKHKPLILSELNDDFYKAADAAFKRAEDKLGDLHEKETFINRNKPIEIEEVVENTEED
jgi:ribosomal subunit interface protein